VVACPVEVEVEGGDDSDVPRCVIVTSGSSSGSLGLTLCDVNVANVVLGVPALLPLISGDGR